MPASRRRLPRPGWGPAPPAHHQLRHRWPDELQPGDRRRRQGPIVREIDALGGAMGRAIDATGIQFRLLNRRKGPAMHGPRAQADKRLYQTEIKRLIEDTARPRPAAGDGREPAARAGRPRLDGRPRIARRAGPRRRRISGRGRRAHHRHLPAGPDAYRRGEDPRRAGGGGHHLAASADRWPTLGFRLDRFKTGTPAG